MGVSMKLRTILLATALGVALPSAAHADESLWIYTKGAETLPKGETEVKVGVVSRRGKADSDYAFNDVRIVSGALTPPCGSEAQRRVSAP